MVDGLPLVASLESRVKDFEIAGAEKIMDNAGFKEERRQFEIAEAVLREVKEDEDVEEALAMDDITGLELNHDEVAAARQEELGSMDNIELFDIVDIEGCIDTTGKKPVSTKWADIRKRRRSSLAVVCTTFQTSRGA